MVADYNGWADLPEAEREALDVLELTTPVLPQAHPGAHDSRGGRAAETYESTLAQLLWYPW